MGTIVVGGIKWEISNSSCSILRDGRSLPIVKSMDEWRMHCKNGEPCCCAYDFDDKNIEKFGLIYNPYVLLVADDFSPNGTRIPTRSDWDQLLCNLGGNDPIDKNTPSPCLVKMKAEKGWLGKMNGTNESGFNALPGGDLFIGKEFRDKGYGVVWWTLDFHKPHITQYDKNKFKFHEGSIDDLQSPSAIYSGCYIRLIQI